MKGGFPFCHCEPAFGGLAISSLGRWCLCHCEASRREAVAISLRKGIASQSCIMTKYEIATPERFSVQARNDRKVQPLQ